MGRLKNRCLLIGNIYPSKGQNGNIYLVSGISPAILSGVTDNKKNGGIGSNNAPKILIKVMDCENKKN